MYLFDFRDRPSVNTVLRRPLLQAKIRKFLTDLVLTLHLTAGLTLTAKL